MPEPSYELAHAARKGPKITMGKGMHRVEPDQGVHEATPQEIQEERRRNEIKERGGLYSDRIKIEPKFGMKEKPPLPSDTEMQKRAAGQETKI